MNALDYPVDHFALMVNVATYLRNVDAQIEEQHYHYTAFGSWWLSFRRAGQVFRLAYDGRDSSVSMERAAGEASDRWTPLQERFASHDAVESIVRELVEAV